jgi:hypothetical protein
MRDVETTIKENDAYYRGCLAYEHGKSVEDNPYTLANGRLHYYWELGFTKHKEGKDVKVSSS